MRRTRPRPRARASARRGLLGASQYSARAGTNFSNARWRDSGPSGKPALSNMVHRRSTRSGILGDLAAARQRHVGAALIVDEAEVDGAQALAEIGTQVGEEPERAVAIHLDRFHRAADQRAVVARSGEHGHRHVLEHGAQASELVGRLCFEIHAVPWKCELILSARARATYRPRASGAVGTFLQSRVQQRSTEDHRVCTSTSRPAREHLGIQRRGRRLHARPRVERADQVCRRRARPSRAVSAGSRSRCAASARRWAR